MSSPARRPPERIARLLAEAHRARNRGRDRRAISLYKRALLEDPRNAELALRLAPLLAQRGDAFEAWQLYRRTANRLAREHRFVECLAVYREACRFVPYEFEAWRLCAAIQIKLGREDAALETLLDGRAYFDDVHSRSKAIALLALAREIEPWDPDILLDLARLYEQTDQADVALELLECLARTVGGRWLRRTRALQWRITLAPRFAYLWLRSLFEGDEAVRDDAVGEDAVEAGVTKQPQIY